MLPQLPELPFDVPTWIPTSLSQVTSLLPGDASVWMWILVGAVLALLSLWALRRARRTVLAAVIGVVGLLLAWNSGFLPLAS